jgi:hypothetical protein
VVAAYVSRSGDRPAPAFSWGIMARNVVEILITAKNQTAAGFKAAKTQVSQFGQALTTVRGLIGTIGVAALATEFYQFAMQSRQASIELESARNKLAQTVGGLMPTMRPSG